MSDDAASILATEDRKPVALLVPEWGRTIYIRAMSGIERDSFEAEMIGAKEVKMANIRARLAVRVVCNEKGERIFRDDQAAELGQKASSALDRVFRLGQKLNGIGSDEVDAAGKGSAGNQSDASGSGSPSPSA